jgi:hypothetical protein
VRCVVYAPGMAKERVEDARHAADVVGDSIDRPAKSVEQRRPQTGQIEIVPGPVGGVHDVEQALDPEELAVGRSEPG